MFLHVLYGKKKLVKILSTKTLKQVQGDGLRMIVIR
jgi:hypothetical protein